MIVSASHERGDVKGLQLGHLVVECLDDVLELLLHFVALGFERRCQQSVLDTHQLMVQVDCAYLMRCVTPFAK